MRQPWIACPQGPRTEGVKIPPVRGSCADFQYFMCIVLPPAGDFLPVAFLYKERVSDGLLFQLEGKVGRRRHVPIKVTCRSQQRQRASQAVKGYHHRYSLSFPSDRPTRPFTCVGAAVGLLQSQFPLQPIANATLESKGSFETIGFKRLFCPLFQLVGKVGRRRHVPYAKGSIERRSPVGGKKETPPHYLTGGHLWKPSPSPQNTSSFRTC